MLLIQLKNTQSPFQVYQIDPYSDGRTKFPVEVLTKGYLRTILVIVNYCLVIVILLLTSRHKKQFTLP